MSTKKLDLNFCLLSELAELDTIPVYKINTWKRGNYYSLNIRVQSARIYTNGHTHLYASDWPVDFSVQWQGNLRDFPSTDNQWYAPEITLGVTNLDYINPTCAMIKRVYDPDPLKMIAKLDKVAARLVCDHRSHNDYRLVDLPDPSLKWYIDDYSAYGQLGCTCGVHANSESQAQCLILVRMAEEGYKDTLAKWIGAGQPVRSPSWSFTRTFTDTRDARIIILEPHD